MTSPARAVQNNTESIRRVQHLSDAAVLLWPDAPDLAQYYLFRMQQAAEKDNLKIPHRTASKICQSCGGLVTSKLRLLSSKRRTRRSAQLAARETKGHLNMTLVHMDASDAAPNTRPRNVLQQHCARCDHKRLYLAFQHAPVVCETQRETHVKQSVVMSSAGTHPSAAMHHSGPINTSAQGSKHSEGQRHGEAHKHNERHTAPRTSAASTISTVKQHTPHKQASHTKQGMKSQVAKMLHETKSSTNKKKNVQHNLKQFLNSINM